MKVQSAQTRFVGMLRPKHRHGFRLGTSATKVTRSGKKEASCASTVARSGAFRRCPRVGQDPLDKTPTRRCKDTRCVASVPAVDRRWWTRDHCEPEVKRPYVSPLQPRALISSSNSRAYSHQILCGDFTLAAEKSLKDSWQRHPAPGTWDVAKSLNFPNRGIRWPL